MLGSENGLTQFQCPLEQDHRLPEPSFPDAIHSLINSGLCHRQPRVWGRIRHCRGGLTAQQKHCHHEESLPWSHFDARKTTLSIQDQGPEQDTDQALGSQ